ncbi:DNA repair protein recO [Williamsoniiplasma somnilux]|uniref:DNA repair protein RecO n=1 Tax=Williamsoniiplasma somnilux TaxID=215578 RepID=A0A2K8NY91_9MOLU|nr:DNA repair protein RecO [Williamsoniiplasma somnilux]ATZ18790.1 DNA repair protein recO [Williamsoniiplasma somnilux]
MAATIFNAIVLDSFDFDENAKIVTTFSDKFGKIAFVALGVNKVSSKNRYSIQTFSNSEFEVFKSKKYNGLSKLKTGILINQNNNIANNYDDYLYVSCISKIIISGTNFDQKNYKLYNLLNETIKIINNKKSSFSCFAFFLFYAMNFFGGSWSLNQCLRCKRTNPIIKTFSFNDFGIICHNCFQENDTEYSYEFISFLKKINDNNIAYMIEQVNNSSFLIALLYALITYYQKVLGIDNNLFSFLLNKKIFSKENLLNNTYSVLTKAGKWV